MKRLLRIGLDTLLASTLPILMWVLLGIIVEKDITNVFSLTYPIQFIITLLLSIFAVGANINQTKNNKQGIVDSNIIIGIIVGFLIILFLYFNVDKYIQFMSMNVEKYRMFCIYSFILIYLQYVLQLFCQKLYYLNENKKSNSLTIFFNLTNFVLIIGTSLITRSQEISILITLIIDTIIIIFVALKNIKTFKFELDILKNMKYVSNDILDRLGMFIIYFIGFKNTFEYGTMYLIAINFETLITDSQWDISYSIMTAATIDASKDQLNYSKSIKNAYKLIGLLICSTLIMGSILYFYYKPELWILSIALGVQILNMLLIPIVWIRQQYCQVNFSPRITTFNQGVEKIIRIIGSFLPTPFCTYIGQFLSMTYQFIIFMVVYRKMYFVENEMLRMKKT